MHVQTVFGMNHRLYIDIKRSLQGACKGQNAHCPFPINLGFGDTRSILFVFR